MFSPIFRTLLGAFPVLMRDRRSTTPFVCSFGFRPPQRHLLLSSVFLIRSFPSYPAHDGKSESMVLRLVENNSYLQVTPPVLTCENLSTDIVEHTEMHVKLCAPFAHSASTVLVVSTFAHIFHETEAPGEHRVGLLRTPTRTMKTTMLTNKWRLKVFRVWGTCGRFCRSCWEMVTEKLFVRWISGQYTHEFLFQRIQLVSTAHIFLCTQRRRQLRNPWST